MRIYLISPTHRNRDGSLHKTTRYWTSGITLPYLKALTPPGHDVSMVDEMFYDVDLEGSYDLVGLTAMGPQIARAYELADHFRGRGAKVVLGGTWVSLTPEVSLKHADAVVVGEAEHLWKDLLADMERGHSRGIYKAEKWHDLVGLPVDRPHPASAAQLRNVQEELVLQDVLPLAGDLLARLSAPLRVLRRADVLLAQLSHAAGRRGHRRAQAHQVTRRRSHPIPRRQSDREARGGERAVPADDPAAREVGEPVHDQHRA
jgi:hypothetical protein